MLGESGDPSAKKLAVDALNKIAQMKFKKQLSDFKELYTQYANKIAAFQTELVYSSAEGALIDRPPVPRQISPSPFLNKVVSTSFGSLVPPGSIGVACIRGPGKFL